MPVFFSSRYITQTCRVIFSFYLFILKKILAAPTACKSSWAGGRTHATATTQATTVATPDP